MTTTTLEISTKELETKVNTLVTQTAEFKVKDDEDLQMADRTLLFIQEKMDEVSALMDPVCAAAHDAHKKATTARGSLMNPLTAAKALVTKLRGAYLLEVENKRKAEEAETKRLADLAQAEADKKWKEEQALLLKKQEDERVEKAAQLEADGKTELAEHVLEAPPPPMPLAPPPVVSRPTGYYGGGGGYLAPTKTSGVASKETFKAVLETDPVLARAQLLLVAKAAVEKPDQFLDFLMLNTSNINAHAKRTKGAVTIPGIPVVKEIGTAVSAGRKA